VVKWHQVSARGATLHALTLCRTRGTSLGEAATYSNDIFRSQSGKAIRTLPGIAGIFNLALEGRNYRPVVVSYHPTPIYSPRSTLFP
jgi:hypothetical protein